MMPNITHYFPLNEGNSDKKLFIIGDSHSGYLTSRFYYLYEKALKNNKNNNFP